MKNIECITIPIVQVFEQQVPCLRPLIDLERLSRPAVNVSGHLQKASIYGGMIARTTTTSHSCALLVENNSPESTSAP